MGYGKNFNQPVFIDVDTSGLDNIKETAAISVRDFNAMGEGADNEEIGIKSAIAYAATVRKKTVIIPDGEYKIFETIVIESGLHVHLQANAVLKPQQDVNVVEIMPNGKLTGGAIYPGDITFTKACIFLNGDNVFSLLNDHVYCEGTVLMGKDHEYTDQQWTGTGIHLYSGKGSNGDPSYVSFAHFKSMGIFNFHNGILLDVDNSIEDESQYAWVNGNTFDTVNMMNCKRFITLDGDSNIPRDCTGNNFTNLQIQVNSYTEWAVNVIGGGWNRFSGTFWDLHRQPEDVPGFRFGEKTRFNRIEGMHGYETPRHYEDKGYMNNLASLTNHVPDQRSLFHPFAVPYTPNSMGNQDDYMIGGHLRGYTVTQIQTPDPDRSPTIAHNPGTNEINYESDNYTSLFTTDTELGVNWSNPQTSYDDPIVLEIDCSSDPIRLLGHLGIVSSYDAYPKNVIFHVHDGSGWIEYGDWYLENKSNPHMVTPPWANVEMAHKIRVTFWGANHSSGRIQISRIYAMSMKDGGNAYVKKDGGDVDGVLNAKGGIVLENRTDDPTGAEIGRIWLRTDLS